MKECSLWKTKSRSKGLLQEEISELKEIESRKLNIVCLDFGSDCTSSWSLPTFTIQKAFKPTKKDDITSNPKYHRY